jgi:hypothetical protein
MAGVATDSMLDLVPDSGQAPLPTAHDGTGLELDIDLSTSTGEVAALPELSLVDIDLPLLDDDAFAEMPAPAPTPMAPAADAPAKSGKPEIDSGLIDFDLFDPNTEARIAPKSTR